MWRAVRLMSLIQYVGSKGTSGKDTRKHTLSDCDYHRDRMPLPVILGDYNVLALTCGKDCAYDAARSAIGAMYRLGSKDRSNGGDERIERQCRRLSPVRLLVQGSEKPNASPLFAKSARAMTYDDTPGSLFKPQLCTAACAQPRGAACLRRLLHETSVRARDHHPGRYCPGLAGLALAGMQKRCAMTAMTNFVP